MQKGTTARDIRSSGVFTDEWGREWEAIVQDIGHNKGHPVSIWPKFKAPLEVPTKYLKIDAVKRTIKVDTARWKADRRQQQSAYENRLMQTAAAMFGDGMDDAIRRRDKALFWRVGNAPPAVEQVEAYEQGHPWVLGLDPVKPKSLAPYFPEMPKTKPAKFLTAAEEAEQGSDEAYPRKVFGGGYETSDGETFQGPGAKARAEEHEASLTTQAA